jgi:hypothetical protein
MEESSPPEALSVRLVSEARQTFGIRAAGQLWLKLHLPLVPAMLETKSQPDLFDHTKTIDHVS